MAVKTAQLRDGTTCEICRQAYRIALPLVPAAVAAAVAGLPLPPAPQDPQPPPQGALAAILWHVRTSTRHPLGAGALLLRWAWRTAGYVIVPLAGAAGGALQAYKAGPAALLEDPLALRNFGLGCGKAVATLTLALPFVVSLLPRCSASTAIQEHLACSLHPSITSLHRVCWPALHPMSVIASASCCAPQVGFMESVLEKLAGVNHAPPPRRFVVLWAGATGIFLGSLWGTAQSLAGCWWNGWLAAHPGAAALRPLALRNRACYRAALAACYPLTSAFIGASSALWRFWRHPLCECAALLSGGAGLAGAALGALRGAARLLLPWARAAAAVAAHA